MPIQQPVQWNKPFVPYDQIASIGLGDLVAVTFVAAATYIDCRQGGAFNLTLTGTLTSLRFLQPWPGQVVRVFVRQDATGSRTITNYNGTDASTTAVKWPSGTAPTLTSTASGIDILDFYYSGESAGLQWYGKAYGQAYA